MLSPTLPTMTGPIYHLRQADVERSDVAVYENHNGKSQTLTAAV